MWVLRLITISATILSTVMMHKSFVVDTTQVTESGNVSADSNEQQGGGSAS